MLTGTTILDGKFDFDNRVASPILGVCPASTGLACWTDSTRLLPVNSKLRSFKARLLASLPMIILSAWPKEIDSIHGSACDDGLYIDIPGIHHMLLWEESVSSQMVMNVRKNIIISNWSKSRFYMRYQVGSIIVTGFRQMDFIADPLRFSLLGKEGLGSCLD